MSICSGGSPIDFYYIQCVTGLHVEAAVQALMSAVRAHGRIGNRYNETMIEAEFRDRIDAARRGELTPIDHVKSIDGYPQIEMFEIRWNDVAVTFVGKDGNEHRRLHLRLLYVEHGPLAAHQTIGLHCHTKSIDGDPATVRSAQDAEIAHAVQLYSTHLSTRWGVPELLASPRPIR